MCWTIADWTRADCDGLLTVIRTISDDLAVNWLLLVSMTIIEVLIETVLDVCSILFVMFVLPH